MPSKLNRDQWLRPLEVIAVSAVAFAAITAWRLVTPSPAAGIGFLYVVPIALLAVRHGLLGGYLGAALAMLLAALWGETTVGVDVGASGYAVRAVTFFSVATVVASQMNVRAKLQGEADRWFSMSDEMCCMANFDGHFTRVNEAWTRHLGYSEAELLGKPFVSFVHPDDVERTNAESAALGTPGHGTVHFENRYRAKDGSWHWLQWSSRSDEKAIYAAARDITQRKVLEARLHDLAHEDALTGLPNRRAWDVRLPEELARASRGEHPMSVVMTDLDKLKEVNDGEGHAAGDRLLKAAGAAWRTAIRDVDFLARLGGDEFGILLPDADLAAARAVVVRMRMAAPDVRFSAGVAEVHGDVHVAIRRADEALYAAKVHARGTTRSAA